MADAAPTPSPLAHEVAAMRQRIADLEAALAAQQALAQALRASQDAAAQIGQSEQRLGSLRHARHRGQANDLDDMVRRQGVELAADAKRQEALSHSAA